MNGLKIPNFRYCVMISYLSYYGVCIRGMGRIYPLFNLCFEVLEEAEAMNNELLWSNKLVNDH